jgi:hypothetical protein
MTPTQPAATPTERALTAEGEVPPDSDERIYASILRENETWAERCRELAAENAAARDALEAAQSGLRDALRSVNWSPATLDAERAARAPEGGDVAHVAHRGNHDGYDCGLSGPHCWGCNEPWPCRAERGVL